MGVRRDFYAALRNDFDSDQLGSFLYDFLTGERRKKGREAGNGKETKWKDGDFSRAPLEVLLDILEDRERKLQLRLDGEKRSWMRELGRRAGGPELEKKWDELELTEEPGRASKEKKQCKLVLDAVKGRPELVTEQDLENLRELALNEMVIKEAKDLLYDAGFPLNGGERSPRKKERILAMMEAWDAWREEKGLSSGARREVSITGAPDAGEREDWHRMFRLLQEMKEPPRLILPVRVDPSTGVGLYLVSAGFLRMMGEDLPNRARKGLEQELEEKQMKCVFTCLGGTDILYQDLDYLYDQARRKKEKIGVSDLFYGFSLTMRPFEGVLPFEVSPEAGERMFQNILGELQNYQFFRDQNGTAPEGVPKRFLPYFWSARREKKDRKALAEAGRQSSELDSKNGGGRAVYRLPYEPKGGNFAAPPRPSHG